jgi:hypothetical protein
MKNVEVEDFVPSVLEVDEFKVNEPVIAKTDNGTRLEWEIDELQPGESRALVYTLKKAYEGTAEVHLPEAEMKSEDSDYYSSDSELVESL